MISTSNTISTVVLRARYLLLCGLVTSTLILMGTSRSMIQKTTKNLTLRIIIHENIVPMLS